MPMLCKIESSDKAYVSLSLNKFARQVAAFLDNKGIETDADFETYVDSLATAQEIYPAFRKMLKALIKVVEIDDGGV